MEDAVIMEKLKTALRQMFGIPQEILSQLSSDMWLCGSPIYLNSVNMVYLFFETERMFHIHISEDNLYENGFHSLAEICAVVKEAREAVG